MSLFRHLVSYFGIKMIRVIFPLLLLPVFTKYLSEDDFGIMSMWLSFYALGIPLLPIGARTILSSEYYQDDPKAFSVKFTSALIIPIIFIFVFTIVTTGMTFFSLNTVEFNPVWNLIIGLLLLTELLPKFTLAAFRFEQKPKQFGAFSIGHDALLYAGMGILLVSGMLWKSRFLGLFLGNIIFSIIGYWYLKNRQFLNFKLSWKYLKEHLKIILPLLPVVLYLPASLAIDKWFLVEYGSKALLGHFEVGLQVSSVILIVATTLSLAWQPKLYQWLSENQEDFEAKIVRKTYITFALVCLAFVGLQLVKSLAFAWVIDEKFINGLKYVLPLSLGYVFFAGFHLMIGYIIYFKQTLRLGLWVAFLLLFKIGIDLVVVTYFSVEHIAWSFPLVLCLFALITWWEANRVMPIKWLLR